MKQDTLERELFATGVLSTGAVVLLFVVGLLGMLPLTTVLLWTVLATLIAVAAFGWSEEFRAATKDEEPTRETGEGNVVVTQLQDFD